QKPDICLQLPILRLTEKHLVQPGASIYAAAKPTWMYLRRPGVLPVTVAPVTDPTATSPVMSIIGFHQATAE
ncbi:hypothetical protein, partial [Erwinia sp. S43]|uniref:hypothetical protein n=1 Tax=Erwinia sp. S43 TaxID=2769339 RepID=UPI001F399B12